MIRGWLDRQTEIGEGTFGPEPKERIPTHRLCALVDLARSTLYKPAADRKERERGRGRLVEVIEQIILAHPGYGYRRVSAQLHREGLGVNHKRVLRLMREESLLCRLRRRWTKTTDSAHGLKVWPNLVKGYQPSGLNQVWVADITYVRLPYGFCFLAALLDAYSRRVVGWELSEEIDARLTLRALDKALEERQPPEGFIHHSDRGVQYACRDYVDRLLAAGARVSMAGKGRPRENAQAESFFGTLKTEEVYLQPGQGYECFADAQAALSRFIDTVYNHKRLHSALGYRPPVEYEQAIRAAFQGPAVV